VDIGPMQPRMTPGFNAASLVPCHHRTRDPSNLASFVKFPSLSGQRSSASDGLQVRRPARCACGEEQEMIEYRLAGVADGPAPGARGSVQADDLTLVVGIEQIQQMTVLRSVGRQVGIKGGLAQLPGWRLLRQFSLVALADLGFSGRRPEERFKMLASPAGKAGVKKWEELAIHRSDGGGRYPAGVEFTRQHLQDHLGRVLLGSVKSAPPADGGYRAADGLTLDRIQRPVGGIKGVISRFVLRHRVGAVEQAAEDRQ